MNQKELKYIRIVTLICFSFGVLGIISAIAADSTSMMFDGMYSFIQSFFILLSGYVVKLISRSDNDKYQFGYGAFEPFFIVIRTMCLMFMNLVLIYGSVMDLLSGGYKVNAPIAISVTAFSAVVCFFVWLFLVKKGKVLSSPLLKAEAKSWLNDTLLSIAVLVSFFIMDILEKAGHSNIANYVDPLITIMFIVVLIPGLAKEILDSTRELLGIAPPPEVQEKLEVIIEKYVTTYDFDDYEIYSQKQGRTVTSIIHIRIKKETPVMFLDKVRKEILKEIKKEWSFSDTDIVFTLNTDWVKYSVPFEIKDMRA